MFYRTAIFSDIKKSGSVVEAKIGISPQTGLSRVEMFQDGQRSAKIDVKSRMGK